MPNKRTIEKCNLCGKKEFEFLFNSKDRMFDINGAYSLNKCKNCKLIFINPLPKKDELAKHYPSRNYYSLQPKNISKKKIFFYKSLYSNEGNKFLKNIISIAKPLFRAAKIIPGGKILDIGCGSGEFLALMSCFRMDCYGIEPGNFDKKIAKRYNLKIKNIPFEKSKFPDNFFDVITLNHVLEHSYDPAEIMDKLFRILKPNGYLIISVPQSNSLVYKIFRENWVQLDAPRHLFTFTPKNIMGYAYKTGFKLEKLTFNSTPFQIIGSVFYLLESKKRNGRYMSDKQNKRDKVIYNFLFVLLLPFTYVLNFLKLGDNIEVILRK